MHAVMLATLAAAVLAGGSSPPAFRVVALGTAGGLAEDNLTSFLVSAPGKDAYLALDAGTLLAGIRVAAARGSLPGVAANDGGALRFIRERVRGYAISHAHFDHIAGMVMNSPEDGPKPLYALDETIGRLRDHVFNGQVWANFGSEGVPPVLGRYRYTRTTGDPMKVDGTPFTLRTLALSHTRGHSSTAFILDHAGAQLVYCGDTGPDALEQSDRMEKLWRALAPLVRAGTLRALFLEVSFPSARKDEALYGHLTPRWMMTEFERLSALVDPAPGARPLRGLNVVVTHIKPALEGDPRAVIQRELAEKNTLGITFHFMDQGGALEF